MPLSFGIFLMVGIAVSPNIVFAILISVLSIVIIIIKKPVLVIDKNVILLFLIILGTVVNIISLAYIFPIFYFFYLMLLHVVIHNTYSYERFDFDIGKVTLIYFVISTIVLLLGVEENGRFEGFSTSATTFSTYFMAVLLVTLAASRSTSKKMLLYSLGFGLIFLTLTRINIVFYLIIPVNELISRSSIKNRIAYIIVFIILSSLAYPIYGYLISTSPDLISVRYSGGVDESYLTRNILSVNLIEEWFSQSLLSKFFGAGTEFSRLYLVNQLGIELLPHNDFLRMLLDYGIVFSLLYVLYIVRMMLKNKIVFHLGLLYFISFYHNMVYNISIVSLMVILYYYGEKFIEDNNRK